LFEKACQHLDRGAFVPAATDFRRAVKRAPDVPEYELHARFAEYRAAGEAERHARLEALEEALQTALKRDRRFAFAHYVFGMLALWRGDDERALSAFDRAVRLGAPLLDAERHRRLLSKRLGKGSRR
jgi:tetratricopeptide (TPR) repeat protein